MPFTEEELIKELSVCRPIDDESLSQVRKHCDSEFGRLILYLNELKYIVTGMAENKELMISGFINYITNRYYNTRDDTINKLKDSSSNGDNVEYRLVLDKVEEDLFKIEIKNIRKDFNHKCEYDLVNKVTGPLKVIASSVEAGFAGKEDFITAINEIRNKASHINIEDKLSNSISRLDCLLHLYKGNKSEITETKKYFNDILNFCTGNPNSIEEIKNMVKSITGINISESELKPK